MRNSPPLTSSPPPLPLKALRSNSEDIRRRHKVFFASLLTVFTCSLIAVVIILFTNQQLQLNFGQARLPIAGSSQPTARDAQESVSSTNGTIPGTQKASNRSSERSAASDVSVDQNEPINVVLTQTSAGVEPPTVDTQPQAELRVELPETALPDSATRRFALVDPRRSTNSFPQHTDNSASLTGNDSPLNVGPEVNSVVFVIDKSGSMSGNKFERTKQSLLKSLSRLEIAQSFCVILFDDASHSLNSINGHGRLSPATQNNISNVKTQLDRVVAVGGTQPLAALQVAISLRPELVILLSDGEFDPNLLDEITQLNHRIRPNGRIDCVGLDEEVRMLRDIAKRNYGGYYQAASR